MLGFLKALIVSANAGYCYVHLEANGNLRENFGGKISTQRELKFFK